MHQGYASKRTLLCFSHLNFKVDVNVVSYLQRQLFHALSGYLQIITNTQGSTRILISKCIDIPQSSPSVVSGWIGFPSLAFSY